MTPARANRHPEAGPPLTVGRRIVRKAVVESTMDEVRAAARAGEPEGLVILAGRQSAGRGRHGRRWLDAPGRDLLASVLLRPDERIAGGLLMMAALAAARTVDALTGARSTIKWPNDVRVGGRKVCGVLAESEAGPDGIAVVLGIGLNVNSDPSGRPDLAATSLRLVAGREVPLDEAER
ncbi:MAG: biotin--[acetyl-CoA-carboxylase] ligase, partial [Gemmatimonadetes bacterium]|nr:biotin--[acetyl-CoA-carboxylase] ligase [Gemmatimonadota bacterium]